VQTLDQVKSAATASQQFNLLLVGLFGVLALVLAAVGLYGVTAYSVSQRTRELGIRVALGARRGALLRLVLAHGARLTLIGLAIGTAAALALTQVMSTLLFGVGARDPLTFVGVALLLLAVSLVASFVPAVARPGSIPWSRSGPSGVSARIWPLRCRGPKIVV
jgi:putative ABC transport system permease protein